MADDSNPTAIAIRHVMDEGARRERLTIVAYLREAGEDVVAAQIENGWHIDPLAHIDGSSGDIQKVDTDG